MDWQAENAHNLVAVFACSITAFIVTFIIITTCVRLHFSSKSVEQLQTIDTPELLVIKNHTRVTRLLSLIGIALQIRLILSLAEIPGDDRSTQVFVFSLFRPVGNLCIYVLGFMTNTHAFFRLVLLGLLVELILVDTYAEVTLAMILSCLETQRLRCGGAPSSLAAGDLRGLQVRDLATLFVNPWLVLEVGYLGLAIGFCSSRFSSRRLSLSRPRFNIRAALAFYFPGSYYARNELGHRSWKV